MLGKQSKILTREEMERKGESGEEAFNGWLKENKLSYLYVRQSPDAFAPHFSGAVKRPDFIILLESIGLIAVDVKNYSPWHGRYTLRYEDEVKKVLAFERLFRIPVWYAYYSRNGAETSWYWISALKALEVGEMKEKEKTGEQFLSIMLDEFCRVRTNADLGQLYTQRLPRVGKLADEIVAPPKPPHMSKSALSTPAAYFTKRALQKSNTS